MNIIKLSIGSILIGSLPIQAKSTALEDWFSLAPINRKAIPEFKQNLNSKEDITAAKKAVWNAYRAGAVKRGWDKTIPEKPMQMADYIQDRQIKGLNAKIGDKTMPYVVITKGKKPESGWPVYFCLHGGGGNPNAKGPHSWNVNTGEWVAQMRLTTSVWESPGIYIIPRMADDRQGRWYYSWNQIFIDQLTQQAILFHDADPNRIYLEGISEGGYAAYRLGSMMADRWAGSCSMAAAEPLGTSPPENLRHVPFRCGIGEKDTMFDRVGLARNYFKRLDELSKKHQGEYVHFHDEQKGKGHGIDYKNGPAWISKFTRNSVPKAITWTVIKQHDRHRQRSYWLALDDKLDDLPLYLTADSDKKTNSIKISAKTKNKDQLINATGINLRLYLSDRLIDLSKPVTVYVNDKLIHQATIKPSMEAIIRSTAERGDPYQVFPAQLKIKVQ